MKSLLIVLFAPLLGAIANRLSAGRLPKNAVAAIACGSLAISLSAAILSFLNLSHLAVNARSVIEPVFVWAAVGTESLSFNLLIDPLSAIMLLVVTGVGFLIHVYSTSYMHEESKYEYARYFAYLNFFVFSMLTLVLAANFMVLFIGWELVGVSSYLLIGYYRSKTSAADAGKKAFIVNRVGDLGFLLAIFIILNVFNSVEFAQVLPRAKAMLGEGSEVATLVALLLFMGAMGKSAQVPLHVWLPDAMEGPTPVSALIHAATMVTAGVFMVARCHAIFELSPTALHIISGLGVFTAVFAASIALVQNDIKRIMAYSTLSQLGYMMLGVGVGAYSAGFFHLFTHAFFKALLFLGCGSVMHAMHGELDMTRMGGLRKKLPITYWTFFIGAICLIGIPGTSGFFSKDEILWEALNSPHGSVWLWAAGTFGSLLTAFYVARLFFKTFHGEPRDHHTFEHAHESAAPMTIPLIVLAVLSIAVGFLGLPHFIIHFAPFQDWLAPVFADVIRAGNHTINNTAPITAHSVSPWALIGIYIALASLGIITAWNLFGRASQLPGRIYTSFSRPYKILWNKYYVDELYDLIFVRGFLGLCRILYNYFERMVVDGAVNATAWISAAAGAAVRATLHDGMVRRYASAVLFGAIAILFILLNTK